MRNSWVCVDASFLVRLLTGPGEEQCEALWSGWQEKGTQAVAPMLLFCELSNALYRLARARSFTYEQARDALTAGLEMPITLLSEPAQHLRALALAQQFALRATYDAHYLAVAESLGAELWTADRRLTEAVGRELPYVRLVGS